jgi:hypothetical protein
VILWLGIGIGLIVGLGISKWRGHPYQPPILHHIWLVIVGFLPQLVIIYLGKAHFDIPNMLVAFSLITSLLALFVFSWLNRHVSGMMILIIGVMLNLAVIAANGGFMPINPQTAERIVGSQNDADLVIGNRIGYKDILLPKHDTHLELLSDRFLLPASFPHQVAFSLGDVFIASGAFWMLAYQKSTL